MQNAIRCAVVLLAGLAVFAVQSPADASPRDARHHVDYMAMGDSITDGVGTSDWVEQDGQWTRVAHSYSYPERAGIRAYGLGTACLMGLPDCLDEKRVADWFPRVVADLPRRPETVVFHIGVNDLGRGATDETLIAELQRLRRIGRSMDVRVVFGTIVPAPRTSTWVTGQPDFQRQRLAINDWIRSQRDHVEYARPLQCDGYLCREYTNPELNDVHVNNAGALIMGRVLRQWVDQAAS